jgi:hypothetical protein
MLAMDLKPFSTVEGNGFRYFIKKNFPTLKLPSESTLRKECLLDVYDDMVRERIKQDLKQVTYASVMIDGWTDRRGRPFFGTRLGYMTENFDYYVVTLSCKIVEVHAAQNIA